MAELLSGLLMMILEVVGEFLLECFVALVSDLLLRLGRGIFQTFQVENPIVAFAVYVFWGMVMGGFSLLVFPHRMMHRSGIPGISLIVSPVLVGMLMSLTGSILRKREKRVIRIESFAYGFAFALGMTLVRFWWAKQ
jgi:hypothetical protein